MEENQKTTEQKPMDDIRYAGGDSGGDRFRDDGGADGQKPGEGVADKVQKGIKTTKDVGRAVEGVGRVLVGDEDPEAWMDAVMGVIAVIGDVGSEIWKAVKPILSGCLILIATIIFYTALSFLPPAKDNQTAACENNAGNTIVIDPGHISEGSVKNDGTPNSDSNPGAENNGIKEREKVLEIANSLKPKLEAKGYNVLMTRTGANQKVTNKDRTELGNSNNAALIFRIHNDDGGSSSGIAFYYPGKEASINGKGVLKGPSADVISKSKKAAETISAATLGKIGLSSHNGGLLTEQSTRIGAQNGGALRGSIYSKVPIVLVEVGFLSNKNDVAWLKNKSNIEKLTDKLTEGISTYSPSVTNPSTPGDCSAATGDANAMIEKACEYKKDLNLYQTKMVKTITDCYGFVATIVKNTVDAKINYSDRAKDAPSNYFAKHPEKYVVTYPINSESQLKPGDMLFNTRQGSHASLYVGKNFCGCARGVISASLNSHPPECSNWYPAMSTAVRLK